jgi:hypothetical protein
VLLQQASELILETSLLVMFLLTFDIRSNLFQTGLTHRKTGVSALPFEVSEVAGTLLQPRTRYAFEFLHPVGLGACASEARKDVYVVFNPTNPKGWTIDLARDRSKIGVQGLSMNPVPEEWPAVLGREDEVDVNGGE